MAIEIKELVIRAIVESRPQDGSMHKAEDAQDSVISNVGVKQQAQGAEKRTLSDEDREAIIAAAVKEVMRILRASKER